MYVDKVPWISHQAVIRSVDVQPLQGRLATSGNDGKVKVWRLLAILSEEEERDANRRNLLASLHHETAVNCVRFSPGERFLAAATDDGCAVVYTYDPNQEPSHVFGETETSVEHWARIFALSGHTSHVTDMAWAPLVMDGGAESATLATCSLDGSVVIWDVGSGSKVAKLIGHKGYVKGLAFDPVGTYLASQGDDKACILWSTKNWVEAEKITDTLNYMGTSTYSQRLAWSPDGRYLALANAGIESTMEFRSPLHARTASFTCEANLLGHKSPIICVRFSPAFYRDPSGGLESVAALGDTNGCITIWMQHMAHPRIELLNLSNDAVTDFAWYSDGRSLFAAFADGTIGHLSFAEDELGKKASDREVQDHFASLYGNQEVRQANVIEEPTMLELRERAENHALSASPTSDRRKANDDSEVRDTHRKRQKNPSPAHQRHKTQPTKQKETRTKEGKRRITPQAVQGSAPAQQEQSPLEPFMGREQVQTQDSQGEGRPKDAGPQQPAYTPQQNSQQQASGSQPTGARRKENVQRKKPAEEGRSQQRRGAQNDVSQSTRLNPPPLQPTLVTNVVIGGEHYHFEVSNNESIGAQGSSPAQAGSQACLRKTMYEASTVEWRQPLHRPSLCIRGCESFLCVVTSDAHVHVFTPAGRRALPPVLVDDAPVFLDARSEGENGRALLLIATSAPSFYLWDIHSQQRVSCGSISSVASYASDIGASISSLSLSPSGQPLAVLSNSFAYVYSDDLWAWVCVADSSFLRSDYTSVLDSRNDSRGDLMFLQENAAKAAMPSAVPSFLSGSQNDQVRQTTGHLESMVGAAAIMGKEDEQAHWLGAYARHLSKCNDESRFRELCESLLGYGRAAQAGLIARAPAEQRHYLLRDVVLPQAARGGGVTRTIHEFKEIADSSLP